MPIFSSAPETESQGSDISEILSDKQQTEAERERSRGQEVPWRMKHPKRQDREQMEKEEATERDVVNASVAVRDWKYVDIF